VIAELSAGQYRIDFSGENEDRARFDLEVFPVGDADGDRAVTDLDLDAIRQGFGASAGDDRYHIALDGDLDGRISATDLTMAYRNRHYSPPSSDFFTQEIEGSVAQ